MPDEETASELIKDGKSIWCGGFRTAKLPCDCPKELRLMIQECLRFESANLGSKDFGRPKASDLKQMIVEMMEATWVDNKLPKIVGKRFL